MHYGKRSCVADILQTSTKTMAIIPTLEPDADNCKLHNSYDVQGCVLAGVSLVLGTAVCFYGYRLFKFVLFLTGFLVAFFFTYVLCNEYLTDKLSGKTLEYRHQIFLGISAGVGLIAGLLTLCIFYVGLFVLGATTGWFIGMAFLPLLYKHSEYLSEHNWLPYIILSAFALAGGIIIICMQKVIIVISTSFLGAFWSINGIDYYVENCKALYYSVNILHGHLSDSMLPHCWYTWLVVSLIPVMFIAGVMVQFLKTGKNHDHREAYGKSPTVHNIATPMRDISDQQPILTDYD